MVEAGFLDPMRLEHLQALGGSGLVARLIDLFLRNAPARIAAARSAQEARDWGGVERAVHALVSSAGNIGAAGLMGLSREIERRAVQGPMEEIPALVRELDGGYERVRIRLEERRKELSA